MGFIRAKPIFVILAMYCMYFSCRCTCLYWNKWSSISSVQIVYNLVVATFFSAALLSVLGNVSVLFSAARRLTVLKAPELLTVNLAITDIGMALSMYPLSIASAFNHAWMGGDTSCLYYGLMGMIFSITSIMTLAVMGMIRYLVTGRPPRKGKGGQRYR